MNPIYILHGVMVVCWIGVIFSFATAFRTFFATQEVIVGKHRRTAQAPHRDPAHGADPGVGTSATGAAVAGAGTALRASTPPGADPVAGIGPGLTQYQALRLATPARLLAAQAHAATQARLPPPLPPPPQSPLSLRPGTIPSTIFLGGAPGNIMPRKIETLPPEVGEIIGWRVWRIDKLGQLRSGYKDTIWAPGMPMTGDVKHDYGIHAFKALDDRVHHAAAEYGSGGTISVAIGRVALWGEVIEHEHGYRAEFAKVVAIDSVVGVGIIQNGQVLKQLRAAYLPPHA